MLLIYFYDIFLVCEVMHLNVFVEEVTIQYGISSQKT
jgi:hypothetical protein